MRGKIKNYQVGDTRTIKRFALLPICTNDSWVWLQWVTIVQELRMDGYDDKWVNVQFLV